jgi:hypothetical protein
MALEGKLHPANFTAMSGRMTAIVGYILGEEWSDPLISDLYVGADGFVLAQNEGDVGYNHFIGHSSDLESNIERLLDVAELNGEERKEWDRCYRQRVRDQRFVRSQVER